MEDYPEELRTPPVTLVSLVGCPELHPTITSHLHSEQPPINTLALPDFSKISVISKTPKENSSQDSGQVKGILKRDWLLKHRTKIPAVFAALFSSDHVSGDPGQWLQVCTDLENIKAVVRGRNIKLLVVVVVRSTSKDDISEDRMIALKKRAEVDSKYLINFVIDEASEHKESLNRLGSMFAELANTYYRDEGRLAKTRLERKNFSSIELYVRYCFKVAVYAEFRRDWVEALRLYEDAYHALREMVGTSTRLPAIQRLVEIKTVAEQLHFKISTLLLHGGKLVEAITWFRKHNASYRKLVGSPEVIFLHWEWLSRQFLVFAELLETSSETIQVVSYTVTGTADKPTEWEYYSAYYFQYAAHYLKEKRHCLEIALSLSEIVNEIDENAESVVPYTYVGQFARLLEDGKDTFALQPLTDKEYIQYALAEGKRFQDSFEIIALLRKSTEAYGASKALRMASYCKFQMAREYFSTSEFNNAKQHFDSVADLYRQQGWATLLWEALGYLRECSRRLGSVKDFIEYSLEMAALPVATGTDAQSFKDCSPAGPASPQHREMIHKEVFGIFEGEFGIPPNEENNDLKVTSDHPLYLEIDLVSPLRVVLLASVAFHEQMVKPNAPTLITLSLLSHLPLALEIDRLEIQFNQAECNFIIINGQRPQLAATSNIHPGRRVETAPALSLVTNKWLRLTYDLKSEQSGKLECIYVIARMASNFTICCRAESPASMNDLTLWKFEDQVESFPTKDPGLAFSGQKATQVEEPDAQVDLNLRSYGPALVGETFIVPVTVASKGHAIHFGELKINLVDTRGGGMLSPREAEPFSADSLNVELVGVSGLVGENDTIKKSDNIQKILPSFGLIPVPYINEGDSWCCKLEIRWHRPKPIMLYVSLGYSPLGSEPGAQKVHVHKNLQIEGKTAVAINHRCMLPFRQDPLLLSNIKQTPDSDQIPSLPLNEKSVLIISAKNCSEVPLQLLSMCIEIDEDDIGRSCNIQCGIEEPGDLALLARGEEFRKVFCVIPESHISKLRMGTVCLRWRRDPKTGQHTASCMPSSEVSTKYQLPDVNVELPPLIVSLGCPPHAILGTPFNYSIQIHNQTQFLQEIKFSLADSQSFVLSGPHNDTTFILPKSEHVLSYKLVPLATGLQQLPRVTVASTRYTTGFLHSASASTIFVYPSKPHFNSGDIKNTQAELLNVS